jgi:Calcineurin-like phosphoesterase/Purple acid Phosphatase, N-terminal domain
MLPGTYQIWGPYLSYGTDSTSEMRITWKNKTPMDEIWIQYGTNEDCEIKCTEYQQIGDNHYTFTLNNLEADTDYFYKISRSPKKINSFHTGLPENTKQSFDFVIMSDMHANRCNRIIDGFTNILELYPDHCFGIATGDSIDDGADMEHWNCFFHESNKYLRKKPLMNATGNHDTGRPVKYENYLRAWQHPYENPKEGGYYKMEYGNAAFIFLDSCNAGRSSPFPGDEQYSWLIRILKEQAKKEQWVFLFIHHQILSTGDFACNKPLYDFFMELSEKYRIDAIFYGHDHKYESFWVHQDKNYGGTLFVCVGANTNQTWIETKIMGDNHGGTKYIWPGRFLNVRKHGVPKISPTIKKNNIEFRMDEVVKDTQLLGVLEPNFLYVKIEGDSMDLVARGWQKQLFHHIQIKRAGTGRKFTEKSEIQIFSS